MRTPCGLARWIAGLAIATAVHVPAMGSGAGALGDAAIERAGALVGFDRWVGKVRIRAAELAGKSFSDFKADLIQEFDDLDLGDAPWPVWEKAYAECFLSEFDAVMSERRRVGLVHWLRGEANIRDLLEFADLPVGQEFFRHAGAMQASPDETEVWLKGLDEARRREIRMFLSSPAGSALRAPPPEFAGMMLEGLPERIMGRCVMDDGIQKALWQLGKSPGTGK